MANAPDALPGQGIYGEIVVLSKVELNEIIMFSFCCEMQNGYLYAQVFEGLLQPEQSPTG